MGVDERHYNINNLNKLFAIASLILLGGLGLMLLADYARGWKAHQTDFQNMEVEKTRVKLDEESTRLAADAEYQKLNEALGRARTDYAANCSAEKLRTVRAAAGKANSEGEIRKQEYRVVKAQLDAAKFHYEEARERKAHDLKISEIRYKSLQQKVKQLNQSIEKSDGEFAGQQKAIDQCGEALKELERQERALTQKATILKRKLARIDPNEMGMTNRIANIVRNLPIIDLANPTQKVQQIVLHDIREDNNFVAVPKVDRCTTCHLGIDNPDFKDAAQPLRTHPNLELFVGKNSPHSLEEFGCTVCHDGRGRGTDFSSAAHTPSSEHQAEEWKKKYGWKEIHHWEKPMLAKPYVEAGCFKCHSGQTVIKGAEKLNLGLNLIERAGCYACHTIEKYKDWPKPGPDLTRLPSKTSKEWTYRWLADPKSFRHDTWMPSFFGQSNNSDPVARLRSEQEILAITQYLFAEAAEFKMANMPHWGDAKKGEELVASVGCMGCHDLDATEKRNERTRERLKREQGPNLVGFGEKTSKVWLYEWLKDPKRYHPGTRMPNLRLSDEEAADIAAFLAQDKNDAFMKAGIPAVNEKVLDAITADLLRKDLTTDQTNSRLARMSRDEKLYFAGQKLISQYGCYSCHEIKGFKGFKPIGTDLTEEGSKAVNKLDFGFVDIEHTKQAWFTQKLKDPRIFDKGKIKAADEKLRMPNYHFSDQETEAIVTAILGFVKDKPGKQVPRTPERLAIEKGQRIVREFNCQGCHIIEDEGAVIRPKVKEWLIKYGEKDAAEAEGMSLSFSPPNLAGEGKKVQTQWLFDFLHDPSTSIRPWLKVRMPTYALKASEINDLLKYFNALDKEEFPFTERADLSLNNAELGAAHKLFSPDYFDCTKCHIVSGKMPAGAPESWAPDFALAEKRLKPEWVIDWIKNPPALLPGTKMPAFFDPQNYHEAGPPDILDGNEDEQIRVLRNYIMSISHLPQAIQSKSPAPAEKAPAAQP